MTDIESEVYNWLTEHDEPFDFQSKLTGKRPELGDIAADFVLPNRNIVLRINDEQWEYPTSGSGWQTVERTVLNNLGFIVVDLYTTDLSSDFNGVMAMAVQGQEVRGVGNDMWIPYQGMYKGVPTIVGGNFGLNLGGGYGGIPDTGSVVAPIVETLEAEDI